MEGLRRSVDWDMPGNVRSGMPLRCFMFISRTATKKVLGLVKNSMYSMSIATNDAADQCPNFVQP